MFQQQMKKYQLERQVSTENDYNEKVIEYKPYRVITMAIAPNNRNQYSGNDTLTDCVEYIGVTRDKQVQKGDRISGFEVEYVELNRLYSIVHMKEINNNGRL